MKILRSKKNRFFKNVHWNLYENENFWDQKFSEFFDLKNFKNFHWKLNENENFRDRKIFDLKKTFFSKSVSNFFRFQKKTMIFFIDRSKILLRIHFRSNYGRWITLSIDFQRFCEKFPFFLLHVHRAPELIPAWWCSSCPRSDGLGPAAAQRCRDDAWRDTAVFDRDFLGRKYHASNFESTWLSL